MDKYLRNWRQDALNKGQHDAAIYIGDKVLALTNSDSDAFWLAQVHFSNNNFTRALSLLSRKDLIARSLSCRYLAAHCYIKQGKYDEALLILGEENPVHLITTSHNARRKLAHINGKGIRRGAKGAHRTDRIEYSEERERDREQEKDIKFQAAMCYLRGLCFAKRNAFDRARDCYKDAVRIDVQCFEAFDQLMRNSLMSPAEELEFLEELDFESVRHDDPSIAQEAAHLTKMLYTTRISKYASPAALSNATETLSTHYNLANNPDLLLTRAETLYTQCRFHESLAITSSILNSQSTGSLDSSSTVSTLGHSPTLYPLHVAALYETSSHTTLFLLSHTLSTHAPHEPYTYLAIGTYYLSTSRIAEARRFFSKASLMDPHSAPAWIGFAHTFAAEGEHDQAIAAYSTAARLFQGSHLPQLFLGMQHLALNNMQLAWEYCVAAFEMSSGAIKPGQDLDPTKLFGTGGSKVAGPGQSQVSGDPLVLNELGVILYHQGNLSVAAKLFRQALTLAGELGCNPTAWVATRANLAHALRRLNRLDEALAEFDECLRTSTGGSAPQDSMVNSTTLFQPMGTKDFSASTAIAGLIGASSSSSGGPPGSVAGYDDRNLIGSIHTSRGLVLLSIPGRVQEAIVALHEAVRVLGGDAGGGGVAGTLLSRAMEVWGLEGDDDEVDEDVDEGAGQDLDGDGVIDGNEILIGRYKGDKGTRSQHQHQQQQQQHFRHGVSRLRKVEDGLDGSADELLGAAMTGLR